jgi:hypothetical protein
MVETLGIYNSFCARNYGFALGRFAYLKLVLGLVFARTWTSFAVLFVLSEALRPGNGMTRSASVGEASLLARNSLYACVDSKSGVFL